MKPVSDIDHLIAQLARLPGLGQRSARRIALHLLKQREQLLAPLAESMRKAAESVRTCSRCGNLDVQSPCAVCADPGRDGATLCVVEEVADLWAIDRTGLFRGRYHVLGGVLSAIQGKGPSDIRADQLARRVAEEGITEVILANNATLEGQTTAHYLTQLLQPLGVRVSRLAQGIPMGGELEYLDDATLGAALQSRLAL